MKNIFRGSQWGAERKVPRAQTRERGPPLARAEIIFSKGAYFPGAILVAVLEVQVMQSQVFVFKISPDLLL